MIAPGDVGLALTEPVHTLFAYTLSDRTNVNILEWLATLSTSLRSGKRRKFESVYKAMLGSRIAEMPPARDYVAALITTLLIQRMTYSRLARDPKWRPALTVQGADRVQAALDSGAGVVFWTLPQEMTAILLRMVCSDNDWKMHHLSHWMHGQSVSRLGIATFNRRDCRIEDQLSDRIFMTDATTKEALKTAIGIVRTGGCVGFRGIGWSARPTYFPFLEGHAKLAFGAPVVAQRTGGKLFTAATKINDGGYELHIEELSAATKRPLKQIGAEFIARLERAALDAPALWPASSKQWKPGAAGS